MEKIFKCIILSLIGTAAISLGYGIENKAIVGVINVVLLAFSIFVVDINDKNKEKERVDKKEIREKEFKAIENLSKDVFKILEESKKREKLIELNGGILQEIKDRSLTEEILREVKEKEIFIDISNKNDKLIKINMDVLDQLKDKSLEKEILSEIANRYVDESILTEIKDGKEKRKKKDKELEDNLKNILKECKGIKRETTNIEQISDTIRDNNVNDEIKKIEDRIKQVQKLLENEFVEKFEEMNKVDREENKKVNQAIIKRFIELGGMTEKNIELLKDNYIALNKLVEEV